MNEIKIKCPTCGKVLRLQDASNINAASFVCPVCKERHIVGECQRFVEQPQSGYDATQYGTPPNPQSGGDNEVTMLQGGGGEATSIAQTPSVIVGQLVDHEGRNYNLRLGVNTIGRKASTSTATVQILTSDRTMSRSHAVIDVRKAGAGVVHVLKNGANKNPSYINGSLIGRQDQFVLNDGDRIKMGCTELVFKK